MECGADLSRTSPRDYGGKVGRRRAGLEGGGERNWDEEKTNERGTSDELWCLSDVSVDCCCFFFGKRESSSGTENRRRGSGHY